jgi:uncharacterized membrane protein YkvA (DUF1232 family)
MRFGSLWGRPGVYVLVALRAGVAEGRAKLRALAGKHAYDSERADRCASKLDALLANPHGHGAPQRMLVGAASRYFLDPNDEIADVRAPDGFADDLQVVEAIEVALKPAVES